MSEGGIFSKPMSQGWANALQGIGLGLTQIDAGRAPDLSPIYARMQEQERQKQMQEAIGPAIEGMNPGMRRVLAAMPPALASQYIMKMMTPQAPTKGVVINGRLVNPVTGEMMADYSTQAAGTEYGLTPQTGVDENGNPVLIQIGKDGNAVQTALPKGVKLSKEPIRIDAGTHIVLLDPITRQPIGEIEKNVSAAAAAQAEGTATGQAAAEQTIAAPKMVAQADEAITLIDSIAGDEALPSITGMVQGRIPPLSQAGVDLNVKIEQLKGKAFLQAFESLKGGGQITEREGQAAQNAMARLDRAQSDEAYGEALAELRSIYAAARRRALGEDVPDLYAENSGVPDVSKMTVEELNALIAESG